jgi:hypothetical protein
MRVITPYRLKPRRTLMWFVKGILMLFVRLSAKPSILKQPRILWMPYWSLIVIIGYFVSMYIFRIMLLSTYIISETKLSVCLSSVIIIPNIRLIHDSHCWRDLDYNIYMTTSYNSFIIALCSSRDRTIAYRYPLESSSCDRKNMIHPA